MNDEITTIINYAIGWFLAFKKHYHISSCTLIHIICYK